MSENTLSPAEIAKALKDAKAKGLPDGWGVKLDKRRRRKWIAPGGQKTCDSIPKALAISVEMGLLPKDTPFLNKPSPASSPPKQKAQKSLKRPASTKPASKPPPQKKAATAQNQAQQHTYASVSSEPDSDPETSLNPPCRNRTVHWDPESPSGSLIGWKIRVWDTKNWRDGRVISYDPYTHKHKLQMDGKQLPHIDSNRCIWLLLSHETVQYARQLVWAHVKGFAWWPAMILDGDALDNISTKKGSVIVSFFSTNEISSLKDNPECIRPFQNGKIDSVIAKNKKKRSVKAIEMAIEEEKIIVRVRNKASKHFAVKAFGLSNAQGGNLLGRRVKVFRSDVNYPYGDWIVGIPRKYSPSTKKWLLSYEVSDKTKTKYDSSWIKLSAKECDYKVLDKKKKTVPSDEDIIPFLHGFQGGEDDFLELVRDRCRSCVDYIKSSQTFVTCSKCQARFHAGCTEEAAATKTKVEYSSDWVCSKCVKCQGCNEQDIAFGIQNFTSSIIGETLDLCTRCVTHYERKQFCPNCKHYWDDRRYERVSKRSRQSTFGKPTKTDDDELFEADSDSSIDLSWYHEEANVWGFTAGHMLGCDDCGLWVHSGCANLTRAEYEQTSAGKHPIYSKEFLCRLCCKRRSHEIVEALKKEDSLLLFAMPVTPEVAPTYHDLIKDPMDLQTISEKLKQSECANYAWIRYDFELMVFNALTFNPFFSKYWNEAKRYYHDCTKKVFDVIGKGAPVGKYNDLILENFRLAEKASKLEEKRVQMDNTTEKKDLVAGAQVAAVTLPSLRSPSDQASCLPFVELKLKPVDAYFCSWMECCFTCGSSGAADTMLFCVDCGEAFHSFCVNAPIHSMTASSVAGWRCPNCKICEISGEVPSDELKMLFCEMCDRAFNCDLLDPPLSAAPEGLWVCGQCVDCKHCHNTKEIMGASVRYWSRDVDKCYRCGGCEGPGETSSADNRCSLCNEVWRLDDDNILGCSKCNKRIHFHCDRVAEQLREKMKNRKTESLTYECPTCRSTPTADATSGRQAKTLAFKLAKDLVSDGSIPMETDVSSTEAFERLCSGIDWSIRNCWRQDYVNIIDLGFAYINGLKGRNVDLRVLLAKAREGTDLPKGLAQRAARFFVFDSERKWQKDGYGDQDIRSLTAVARMSAAFIKVVISGFNLDPTRDVSARADYHRFLKLLVAPNHCGLIEYPVEVLPIETNKSIIQPKDWAENYKDKAQLALSEHQSLETKQSAVTVPQPRSHTIEALEYIIPKPVCGWNNHLKATESQLEWRDPRLCCLCRTCGDDDGDSPDPEKTADGAEIARMGRLLPMADGVWVHASCALWSSEVFEKQCDRKIHSMEKAKSRGSQLKCFGCGRPGATVGCFKANCSHNYHFPCAKACGAVFTAAQQMYCETHKGIATEILPNPNVEHMKTLIVADEDRESGDAVESSFCSRVGSLIVQALGHIEQNVDGFHNERYIMPPGYIATRIFWSAKLAKTRTVYILRVTKRDNTPVFSIVPGDDPSNEIISDSPAAAYQILRNRVMAVNEKYFSRGDYFSKLPVPRRSTKKAFGLNGYQFFGFGLNHIRKMLEKLAGVEALVAPLADSSPSYRFCFHQPSVEAIVDLQRKRAAIQAENALENASGSARTEGMKAVVKSGGSGRITRALVRSAAQEDIPTGKRSDAEEKKARADRESNQQKYRELKAVPMEQRLAARRSHIHGWGLFSKVDIKKDGMIVEYMGECIRQCIADKREKEYEMSGIGSCYMFRLDRQRIVDATTIGCMARFMNHSCRSNAYAKVISVDTELGPEKKIVVFANRKIHSGEEITYDYKFPVEDGSLRCTCGAPNCIGRMN